MRAVGVFEDEAQLPIPHGRQDRVGHHTRQRRGQIDHRGLMPVRQHERHHAARRACARAALAPTSLPAGRGPGSPADGRRRSVPPAAGSVLRPRAARRPAWPYPPAVCVGGGGALVVPANPSPADQFSVPSRVLAWLRCRLALDSPHRHRVTEAGRGMGVDRDLGDLSVGCRVGALHLQRWRAPDSTSRPSASAGGMSTAAIS